MSAQSDHPAVHDPTVLRAIAHPTRNRILGELYARGHLRAADVAAELDIPANQASFHLRQLAKYGLIEPAPEHARDGRDRVWKLVDERGFDLNPRELREQPGGAAAVSVWHREAKAQAHAAVERAYRIDHPREVRVTISDDWVRLTKSEAGEYVEELLALQEKWQRKGREASAGETERRTYHLLQILQPAPGRGADTHVTDESHDAGSADA